MTPSMVYKIAPRADWEGSPIVPWSAHDTRDGFVHLSTKEQLRGTALEHFADMPHLVVLELDAERLRDLRWEPSRGGALFPHAYADIPRSAVTRVFDLVGESAGQFAFPQGA
jgi:uncharacterized protein (DUF952 family)